MKECTTCGELFEDFGDEYLTVFVCPKCFAQSCREVNEAYEKKRDDTSEETI